MDRKIVFIFVSIALVCILCTPVWSQDSAESEPLIAYSKGDQNFILNGGLFMPLFFLSTGGDYSGALEKTGPGITGSISWLSFLDNRFSLGFEFGGSYSSTLSKRTFLMIPVLGKIGYSFVNYPFEIPLSLGVGIDFVKLDEMYTTTAVFKPEAGFYWNWRSEWAFGANVAYWFVPEIYFSEELRNQSMFGNFLDIRFSVLYHF